MKEIRKNTVTLKAERPAYGGLSICRRDGRVIMITGAIPGETVEARIDQEKKDYSTATAVRILEPSPDRIEPVCRYFGECGGCQLQHISYERQVAMKQEILSDCLRRIAKIPTMLSVPLIGKPLNYRRRAQFKHAGGMSGFYRKNSRDVVDIDSCPLMYDGINDVFSAAKKIIAGYDVKELHVAYGELPVALVKTGRGAVSGLDSLARALMDAGLSGVSIDTGGRRVRTYGAGHTAFELMGLGYAVSPMSFFQGNWELNRELVRLVVDSLQPLSGKRVLDLYSGAGNFSLPLSVHAEEVIAVEESPDAIADGKRNLEINGITNCRLVRSDVESIDTSGRIDILVTDPPRAGLTNRAIEKIMSVRPGRIVYVSCNPATFSRDLRKLSAAYELDSVRMVDFFPQTFHIESAAFLRLK